MGPFGIDGEDDVVDAPPQPSEHERSNAMLCHLLALAAFVVPLGNIVGPLIVWLAQKGKSEFIDRHGRESLNFQITMTLASAVATRFS